jgi:hypothetical protein
MAVNDQFAGYAQQGLLAEPMDISPLGDFGRGLQYSPFDLLGAPVDLMNMGLQSVDALYGAQNVLGSERPFLGSEYLIDKYADLGEATGLFDYQRPTGSLAETAGRITGGVAAPFGGAKALASMNTNVSSLIKAARDARSLRDEAADLVAKGDDAGAAEASQVATVLEVEAAPLVSVLQRIDADGKVPKFTVKDDGTYLSVGTDMAEPAKAADTVSEARRGMGADEARVVGDEPLSKEEIRFIIESPELNAARRFGDDISMAVTGRPFDTELILGDTGRASRESSIAKQAAIGQAFRLAVQGSPEYKSQVFAAYGEKYPSVLEAVGARDYDDLVQKSYLQMQAETEAQFNRLPVNTFYHPGDFDYVTSQGGTNSIGMLRDVIQNQNLNVFRGGDPHEFLSRVDPATGLSSNEKFRAVHDYAGHGILGNKFDALGEERAYAAHSQMYSPLARMAMASETRGQNSFVNYSPLNVEVEAQIAREMDNLNSAKTDAAKAEINERIIDLQGQRRYGDQVSVLLPPEMLDVQYSGGMPGYLRGVNQPLLGSTVDDVPVYHYSKTPGLLEIDPSFVGTRMGPERYGNKEAASIEYYDRPDRSYYFADEAPQSVVDPAMSDAVAGYEGRASGLYDVGADPINLKTLAQQRNKGVLDKNLFLKDLESSIRDYGYSGYVSPFAGGRAALLFDPLPVTPNQGILVK